MDQLSRILPVLVVLAVGCSAPDPFKGAQFSDATQRPTLPYIVALKGIRVNDLDSQPIDSSAGSGGDNSPTGEGSPAGEDGSPSEIPGVESFLLTRPSELGDVAAKVKEGLERYGVFTAVYTADETPAPGLEPELELTINISQRANQREFADLNNGYKWVNLPLWLFAGIPGWIIEDTEVDPGVLEITYELRRNQRGEMVDVMVDNLNTVGINELNFLRRASWMQYLTQIIIPPFLVGSDYETANEELYENYVSRLQSDLSSGIKTGLIDSLGARKVPQLLVTRPSGGRIEAVVFSDRVMDGVSVELIRDGSSTRIVDGAEPENARSTWRSTLDGELGELDALGRYAYQYKVVVDVGAEASGDGSSYLRFTGEFPHATGFDRETWTSRY